jgi:hypothetical protein
MLIEVIRNIKTNKSTEGSLLVNGNQFCYTLEDVVREVIGQPVSSWKVQNETAIPAGSYKVIISHSNHFNKYLPEILNVPEYAGVRIHCGNTAADTEGCILLGTFEQVDAISGSRSAFDKLFPLIQAAYAAGEEITLKIS